MGWGGGRRSGGVPEAGTGGPRLPAGGAGARAGGPARRGVPPGGARPRPVRHRRRREVPPGARARKSVRGPAPRRFGRVAVGLTCTRGRSDEVPTRGVGEAPDVDGGLDGPCDGLPPWVGGAWTRPRSGRPGKRAWRCAPTTRSVRSRSSMSPMTIPPSSRLRVGHRACARPPPRRGRGDATRARRSWLWRHLPPGLRRPRPDTNARRQTVGGEGAGIAGCAVTRTSGAPGAARPSSL